MLGMPDEAHAESKTFEQFLLRAVGCSPAFPAFGGKCCASLFRTSPSVASLQHADLFFRFPIDLLWANVCRPFGTCASFSSFFSPQTPVPILPSQLHHNIPAKKWRQTIAHDEVVGNKIKPTDKSRRDDRILQTALRLSRREGFRIRSHTESIATNDEKLSTTFDKLTNRFEKRKRSSHSTL